MGCLSKLWNKLHLLGSLCELNRTIEYIGASLRQADVTLLVLLFYDDRRRERSGPSGSVQCSAPSFILGPSVRLARLSLHNQSTLLFSLAPRDVVVQWLECHCRRCHRSLSLWPTIEAPRSRQFDACLQTRYADSLTLSAVSWVVRSDLPRRKAMAFTSLMMSSLIFLTASTLQQTAGRCLGSPPIKNYTIEI